MRRRKARTRRLQFGSWDDGSSEDRFIERKVERIGRLRGDFGVAVAARDIAKGELCESGIGVHGRLSLLLGRLGLLLALGFDEGFVFRGQDFRAPQIFFGVNVLLLFDLVFAGALLARGFGYVPGGLGAALRGAEKQTGADNDGKSATKRLAERNPPVHLRLAGTGEVSVCHLPTDFGGTSDGEILL